MIKLNHIVLAIVSTLCASHLHSQCRISIEAPDSLAFLFSINDQQVNQLPLVYVTLNHQASGKLNFKADFPYRPELSFSQVMTIKKDAGVAYSIESSKGALKFVLKSESVVSITNSGEPIEQATAPDAEVRHSGCYPVTDDAEYREMHAMADEQLFESKKLSTMTTFVSTKCLRVDQLQFMMSKLTQEENKLALLSASKDHIYDPENIRSVLDEFFLARTRAKAEEIIGANR